MAIKPEEKYQRTTKEQEFQYKLGKFTILIALIVEIINVIPGTIFGNLGYAPGHTLMNSSLCFHVFYRQQD